MDGGLFFPVAVGGVSLAFFLAQAFGRAATWRHAALTSGLRDVREKSTLGFVTELHGQADDLEVTLEGYHRGRHEHGTRIVVDGHGHIPVSLNLRAEGFTASLDKTFGGKELEIGDPGFDREIYVRGPENLLLPLLDVETRSAVRSVVALRGQAADGTVRIEVRTWNNANRIASALDKALAAARRLRRPDDPVERLVKIAATDYYPAVRVRCLDLLRRAHAEDERAHMAFRNALRSADTETRLIGAIALADEGQSALIEIASHPDTQEPFAARAITALGTSLPPERAASILEAAIQTERNALALAAVGALGLVGGALAVSRLALVLGSSHTGLAAAAAGALASIGDVSAETPLIAALSSEQGELRIAAAQALGSIGCAVCVAPLHAAVDAHLLDLGLRSVARQAIAAIQARLPGASPGQVSLAEGEGGRVSLAGDEQVGHLSIVQPNGPTPFAAPRDSHD
jgi:HEAT repeat protein